MTSSRRLFSSLAVLALLASVSLADATNARRFIGFAKEIIDREDISRISNARNYLTQAEQALTNVPEAERAPFLTEITELKKKADVYERAYNVRNADGMLQREYDQLKEAAEGKGRNTLDDVEDVEPMFVRIQNNMRLEICTKNFTPEHMAEWQAKVDALRGVAMRTVYDTNVKQAEDYLQQIEARNAGQNEDHSEETFERDPEYVTERVNKLPDTDPRKQQLRERHRTATANRARRIASDEKEHDVNAFREHWGHNKRNSEGSWSGFEREGGYEFSQWWREHGNMNLERTENRWAMVARAVDDERWRTGAEKYADDPRVKAILTEAASIKAEAATKICAVADKMLEGAEGKAKDEPQETKDRVLRVLEKLEKFSPDAPDGARVIARARALLNRIHQIEVDGVDPGNTTPTATATTPPESGKTDGGAKGETDGGKASSSESSGVGILGYLGGCFCCLFLLAGIGGGVFFAMKQSKAAGASAAAAPPPAAPPAG